MGRREPAAQIACIMMGERVELPAARAGAAAGAERARQGPGAMALTTPVADRLRAAQPVLGAVQRAGPGAQTLPMVQRLGAGPGPVLGPYLLTRLIRVLQRILTRA